MTHSVKVITWCCAVVIAIGFAVGCSNDNINKTKRKMVEYIDGDYKVTFHSCSTEQTWQLKDSKVTSATNGYYFFWIDGKYIQVPVNQTVIEEQ